MIFCHYSAFLRAYPVGAPHFDPDMVDAFVDIAEDFRSIAQKYPDPG